MGLETFSIVSKVTQLVSSRTGIATWVCLIWKTRSAHHTPLLTAKGKKKGTRTAQHKAPFSLGYGDALVLKGFQCPSFKKYSTAAKRIEADDRMVVAKGWGKRRDKTAV